MADLLPPSPSAAVNGTRHFPGFSSVLLPQVADANSEETNTYSDNTSAYHKGSGMASHQQRRTNMSTGYSETNSEPVPSIRTLDYSSLVTENSHSAELDRSFKTLTHLLSVIEAGFNTMLDKTIEEEDGSFADTFNESMHSEVDSSQLV